MNLILNSIMSGFASVGYSLLYRSPKKSLVGNFITGATGMLVYKILWDQFDMTFGAYLAASVVIGIVAEIFARINKLPATVFLASGLIPLVPGLAIYNMMNAFATKNFNDAVFNIANAGIYALGLALGVVLSSIFSKSLNNYRTYFKKVQEKRFMKKKTNKTKQK
ncbi:threonine/serine exporter family protein [Lagierella sp.]|uniref:threonine/serine exporter family protein n=1 Tax=Lagierella sp. TaxID=2849657 RepID=UPI00262E4A2D|nr:threonine/serine exporter family protein [Lagierella sp.]